MMPKQLGIGAKQPKIGVPCYTLGTLYADPQNIRLKS